MHKKHTPEPAHDAKGPAQIPDIKPLTLQAAKNYFTAPQLIKASPGAFSQHTMVAITNMLKQQYMLGLSETIDNATGASAAKAHAEKLLSTLGVSSGDESMQAYKEAEQVAKDRAKDYKTTLEEAEKKPLNPITISIKFEKDGEEQNRNLRVTLKKEHGRLLIAVHKNDIEHLKDYAQARKKQTFSNSMAFGLGGGTSRGHNR